MIRGGSSNSTTAGIRSEEQAMQSDEENLEEEIDDQAQQQQQQQQQYSFAAAAAGDLPAYDDELTPVDNSSVYQAFGRDTAAGRALFKLYNKNRVNYAPHIHIRTHPNPVDPLTAAAERRKKEAAALKKKEYQPPKLKKAEKEPEVGFVPLSGGKKTTTTIALEHERDVASGAYQAPSVPLMELQRHQQQKTRLQQVMADGGSKPKNYVPPPLPGKEKKSQLPVPSRRDPNQVLYDKIIDEIDERHQFLDRMRASGDFSHEEAIKAEIAHRLRDLNKLQQLLEEEKRDGFGMGPRSSSSSSGNYKVQSTYASSNSTSAAAAAAVPRAFGR